MSSLPLVGAEVQRIRVAFTAVSGRLEAALSSLSDVDGARVGTPGADAAVETGMSDLVATLRRLQASAEDCTSAMRRHGVDEDVPTGTGTSDSSGEGVAR